MLLVYEILRRIHNPDLIISEEEIAKGINIGALDDAEANSLTEQPEAQPMFKSEWWHFKRSAQLVPY